MSKVTARYDGYERRDSHTASANSRPFPVECRFAVPAGAGAGRWGWSLRGRPLTNSFSPVHIRRGLPPSPSPPRRADCRLGCSYSAIPGGGDRHYATPTASAGAVRREGLRRPRRPPQARRERAGCCDRSPPLTETCLLPRLRATEAHRASSQPHRSALLEEVPGPQGR